MTVKEFFEEHILFKPNIVDFFDSKNNIKDDIQSYDVRWFIEEYGTRKIKDFLVMKSSRIYVEIE